MLRKLRERIQNEESGFTLIELLVVILIIGILAAIALPAFLGQQTKGQDSDAKSNARNLVSQVESCFTGTQTYADCTDLENTGLTLGAEGGQVQVNEGADVSTYSVTAVSESGNTFTIAKGADGALTRSCTISEDEGGCTSSWGTVDAGEG